WPRGARAAAATLAPPRERPATAAPPPASRALRVTLPDRPFTVSSLMALPPGTAAGAGRMAPILSTTGVRRNCGPDYPPPEASVIEAPKSPVTAPTAGDRARILAVLD